LALFLARFAPFRFGVRFATLPAAFFAGFFAVFRFVAIEPSYRPASHCGEAMMLHDLYGHALLMSTPKVPTKDREIVNKRKRFV
jgi:hypothetical protein